ncbi:MAG: metallopeptidase family protein [Propionibacteriaceae bacterium]|nr:metallopeptidase family protein [Propionibacteriaceae bacterium]
MRDRHRRGMKGMLAPPNCVAGQMLRLRRPTLPTAFFFHCVSDAIGAIDEAVPDALTHLDIGVEEVPDVSALWSSHMPLAAAIDADDDHLAQIVVYRRPIEFRASSQAQLRQLVFVALVEQVSSVTGLSVATLDPSNIRGE